MNILKRLSSQSTSSSLFSDAPFSSSSSSPSSNNNDNHNTSTEEWECTQCGYINLIEQQSCLMCVYSNKPVNTASSPHPTTTTTTTVSLPTSTFQHSSILQSPIRSTSPSSSLTTTTTTTTNLYTDSDMWSNYSSPSSSSSSVITPTSPSTSSNTSTITTVTDNNNNNDSDVCSSKWYEGKVISVLPDKLFIKSEQLPFSAMLYRDVLSAKDNTVMAVGVAVRFQFYEQRVLHNRRGQKIWLITAYKLLPGKPVITYEGRLFNYRRGQFGFIVCDSLPHFTYFPEFILDRDAGQRHVLSNGVSVQFRIEERVTVNNRGDVTYRATWVHPMNTPAKIAFVSPSHYSGFTSTTTTATTSPRSFSQRMASPPPPPPSPFKQQQQQQQQQTFSSYSPIPYYTPFIQNPFQFSTSTFNPSFHSPSVCQLPPPLEQCQYQPFEYEQ